MFVFGCVVLCFLDRLFVCIACLFAWPLVGVLACMLLFCVSDWSIGCVVVCLFVYVGRSIV